MQRSLALLSVVLVATLASPIAAGAVSHAYVLKMREEARLRARASNVAFYGFDAERQVFEFRAKQDGPIETMTAAELGGRVGDLLRDQTAMTHGGGHGYQVEYTDANNSAFLWYPGNAGLVRGHWRVAQNASNFKGKTYSAIAICYVYANSSNPLTGARPEQEQCTDASYLMIENDVVSVERRSGDVFKLSEGSIPYTLGRDIRPAWPMEAH